MFKIISPGSKFFSRCINNDSFKRFFLSEAYKCEEAWASRLKNRVFQKTNPNNLYHDLDICFQNKKGVSVVDIDILVNSLEDYSFKNELDDVLLRVRLGPESGILPERTTHAAIRWYIKNASKEELFEVLSNRIHYGVFPDYYLNNYLMDKFLKEKDAVSAVKVAVLQMLQEDFEHPIMKVLALHCCYKYLESPDIWESYKEPEPDPDEEVQKVRVRYIRNPYFDDHFDITDTNHLVGKTLWLFGRTVDGAVGDSSQLVGLVLYEKYDRCAEFLEMVIQEGRQIHEEAVIKAKEFILKRPKQVVEEAAAAAAESGEGEAKQSEVKEETSNGNLDEGKSKVLGLLEKIDKKKLIKESLSSATEELVKKAVADYESSDIKHQCEVYKKWEEERESNIQREIEKAHIEKVKAEIEKSKAQLEEEEEKLFFFENEEDILLKAQVKEKVKEQVVFYKGKRKHKEHSTDDYIPPDVTKRL